MDATEEVDVDPVAPEQGQMGVEDDRTFDNIEDALNSLEDDDEDGNGEPAPEEEGEEPGDDDAQIELDDGTTVTLEELKEAKLTEKARQADYTRKTQELAEQRKVVEQYRTTISERAQFVETVMQNIATYIQSSLPPEPPLSLAQTDPGQYQFMRAQREAAQREMAQIISAQREVQGALGQISEADRQAYIQQEEIALTKAMPFLSDPAKRVAFDQAISSFAKSFGFSDEEIASTYDHRVKRLVHYARLGMRAEQNRGNAVRRKVETPREATPTRSAPMRSSVNVENKKLMHRLAKTGSLKDAVKVDFE